MCLICKFLSTTSVPPSLTQLVCPRCVCVCHPPVSSVHCALDISVSVLIAFIRWCPLSIAASFRFLALCATSSSSSLPRACGHLRQARRGCQGVWTRRWAMTVWLMECLYHSNARGCICVHIYNCHLICGLVRLVRSVSLLTGCLAFLAHWYEEIINLWLPRWQLFMDWAGRQAGRFIAWWNLIIAKQCKPQTAATTPTAVSSPFVTSPNGHNLTDMFNSKLWTIVVGSYDR